MIYEGSGSTKFHTCYEYGILGNSEKADYKAFNDDYDACEDDIRQTSGEEWAINKTGFGSDLVSHDVFDEECRELIFEKNEGFHLPRKVFFLKCLKH